MDGSCTISTGTATPSGAWPSARKATGSSRVAATARSAGGWCRQARLNDLSEWKVYRGEWEKQADGSIIGSGDSLLAFREPLPGRFTLEFDLAIASGIRPRVHLTETGLFLGNEGFERQFGIYANETGELQGRSYSYRQGERLSVRVTLRDEHLTLAVNGDVLHTARCNAVESTALSIRGGDGFSRGKVVYSDFRLYRISLGAK